jgi:hypothetical protein
MTAVKEDHPIVRLVNPETGARFEFRGRWLRNSPATDRDIKAGRARFRGDKVYLNLPPGVQAQLEKGVLQMDTDYSARQAFEAASGMNDEAVPQPAGNASRETWISYAISQGMLRDEATALTRDQIKARFAEPAFDPDAPPETIGEGYELLNGKP